ncbi:cytochrome b5-like heme/steroid binding domain-containing protein [Halomonas sp.]|uniref:cytochrome b5-like heme/steroid binding domain-containing protein n=1 Tax=Halomonas sp. TaxID=1486246 RepID=UPI00298DEF6F|nr:cytochrome b5-like heme/steroid binding domain-containing protein [Halomonas sp.]MDW7748305.1 cytochrome b5-like heme/steroid binding domain-containing protein [Halomonas sp.]
MNIVAYTAFVAFLSSVLTLVSINALSSPDAAVPGDPEAITREELARHDSAESCWKAIHGAVYDVTGFISDHPTPAAVMLEWCGRDASEAWENKRPGRPHSSFAEGMLERFRIGRLVD